MNTSIKIRFIYADLMRTHNSKDEIRLDTYGTSSDLERYHIKFMEGSSYWFWSDDLEENPFIFQAKVYFNKGLKIWIGKINLKTLNHLSESEFRGIYNVKDITNKS